MSNVEIINGSEVHYEWVYEVTGPSGKVLYRTEDPEVVNEELARFEAQARMLGFEFKFPVRRRKRATATYISEWETVNV